MTKRSVKNMSPRTEKQLKELRAQSREKIMQAAVELFAMNGFHATSVSQIAKKAGISKGLMYNYFQSKDELLNEMLKASMQEMEEPFFEVASIKDPFQRFGKVIGFFFEMIANNTEYWQFMFSIMTQHDVIKHIKEKLITYFKSFVAILEQLFTEMGIKNAKIEAYKLGAMLDGIMLDYIYFFNDKDYPLNEIKKDIIKEYTNKGKNK